MPFRRVILDTARLRLRPFTAADTSVHRHLYRDPEVTRYLGGGPFLGDEVGRRSTRALTQFARHWRQHGFGVWAVVERASGRVVGQCGLNQLPERADFEVLYALERGVWCRGLASEAAAAAVRYGFDVVGLDRIVAVVRHSNTASRRVLEKLGMHHDGDVEIYGLHAAWYVVTRAEATAAARRSGGS